MITLEHITNILKGFYPNTSLLTPAILTEMYKRLKGIGWTNDTFDRALSAYRNDSIRVDRKETRVPPTLHQLVGYSKRRSERVVAGKYADALPDLLQRIAHKEMWYRIAGDKPKRRNQLVDEIIELHRQCREEGIEIKSWLNDLPYEEKPSYLRKD